MEVIAKNVWAQTAELKEDEYKHPFLNSDNAKSRLLLECFKYHGLIVAFDFDNTIYDRQQKGYDLTEVIDLLRECSNLEGFTMVLFTVEFEESKIEEKKKYCQELGIRVDFVNTSPIMSESRKPYYNILLDDRAGLREAYETLNFVVSCEKELKISKLCKKLWKNDQK